MPSPPLVPPALPPFSSRTDLACRAPGVDPDIFFSVVRTDDADGAARQVCAGCPARRECLRWAVEHDRSFGVWGGATPEERRAIWAEMRSRGWPRVA